MEETYGDYIIKKAQELWEKAQKEKCNILSETLRGVGKDKSKRTAKELMNELLKSKGWKPRRGKVIKCRKCGREYYRQISTSINTKYCSLECYKLGQRTGKLRKCKECGKEYYRSPSQVKWRGSSFCSYPCANK